MSYILFYFIISSSEVIEVHDFRQCPSPEARMRAPRNQHALKGQKLIAQGSALGCNPNEQCAL
nr:hypothetical protein [Prevotella sp.]